MLGMKTYLKSSVKINELSYEKITKRLSENVLIKVCKEIYTNDLGELMLIVTGYICTEINDMVIDNKIKTAPKWYKAKDTKCYKSELKAFEEGLEELSMLCDSFNIKDKEILDKLLSKNLRS